jgi:hypothetical protein
MVFDDSLKLGGDRLAATLHQFADHPMDDVFATATWPCTGPVTLALI